MIKKGVEANDVASTPQHNDVVTTEMVDRERGVFKVEKKDGCLGWYVEKRTDDLRWNWHKSWLDFKSKSKSKPKPKRKPGAAAEVAEVEKARAADVWKYSHKKYPLCDWQYEVTGNDTRLGYFDWVINKIELNK